MRIALVIETMAPSRGGRETSTAEMATALSGRGCDVTILCRSASWQSPGVEICSFGRRGTSRTRRLRNFIDSVQKGISDGRYDVVHATLPVPGADIYQIRSGTIPALRAASIRRASGTGTAVKLRLAFLRDARWALAYETPPGAGP